MKNVSKKNQSGMATLESLPLLVVFVILSTYSLGFFGVVHSAILQSIGARQYAFETFRHRNNVTYFRHQVGNPDSATHFKNFGFRLHMIKDFDPLNEEKFPVTSRAVSFRDIASPVEAKRTNSNSTSFKNIHDLQPDSRLRGTGANPVWIMISHGICINAKCGQ